MDDPVKPEPQPLVYGEIDDGLVFIPRARAEELIESGDYDVVWPAQEMREVLPPDLLSAYGVLTATLLDGDYVKIPLQGKEQLVRELESRGWECEEDDAMVLEASGYV